MQTDFQTLSLDHGAGDAYLGELVQDVQARRSVVQHRPERAPEPDRQRTRYAERPGARDSPLAVRFGRWPLVHIGGDRASVSITQQRIYPRSRLARSANSGNSGLPAAHHEALMSGRLQIGPLRSHDTPRRLDPSVPTPGARTGSHRPHDAAGSTTHNCGEWNRPRRCTSIDSRVE